MYLSQYADLFLAESREHVSACNALLLALERNPAAKEPVSGIFRAMHTVKGMAATMGYTRVAELAHAAETLLDGLRDGATPVSDETIQLLFRAVDGLERSIQVAVGG
ncbi:MAG: Hpt domain-containing protein, partial [Gemmatimonadaceae bacterium]